MARRTYIDWLRGVAVLFMIEWHAVDAWTRLDARDSTTFGWLIFIGGWAAPMFLFLAGVSVALGGEAKMARSPATPAARRAASWALQKRGWEIFLIAHLFRLFSLLLAPGSRWSGVFKPDILNILGLGIVGSAFCWGRIPAADNRSRPEVRSSNFEVRTSPQPHASHYQYITLVNVGESCVIEPSVECNHCGYCRSHGH
jgi:uncharacterized membrane protein